MGFVQMIRAMDPQPPTSVIIYDRRLTLAQLGARGAKGFLQRHKVMALACAVKWTLPSSGIGYGTRYTVGIQPDGSTVRFFVKRYGKRVIRFPYPETLQLEPNELPTSIDNEATTVSIQAVPFAAPPKFGPDVMGEDAWREQMQKHEAWLAYYNQRQRSTGSGGEGTANADAPIAPEATGGEASVENDVSAESNEQQGEGQQDTTTNDKEQGKMSSGKPGKYNVYGQYASNVEQRIASNVEASSEAEAIERAVKTSSLQMGPGKWHDLRATRQRGAAFGEGRDERRRNDPANPAKGGKGSGKGKPSKQAAQGDADGESDGEGLQGDGEQQQPKAPQNGDVVLTRLNDTPLIGEQADAYIALAGSRSMKEAIDEAFAAVQEKLQAPTVDPAQVERICRDVVAEALKAQPVTKVVFEKDGTTVTIDENLHPLFSKVMALLQKRKPVYLWGPSGSGKTHLAGQVARAMTKLYWADEPRDADGIAEGRFYAISVTMGTSESQLQGWRIPLDAGKFVYVPSEFVRIAENGGVFLLDEADKGDPNILSVLNQLLANKRLPIPARFENPMLKLHKDCFILAAGNTSGQGNDRLYSAAVRLDEAFLDRFRVGTLRMDYDTTLERTLVGGDTLLLHALWFLRKQVAVLRTERVISTRSIIDFHQVFDGTTTKGATEAVERLLEPWPESERQKFSVGSVLQNAGVAMQAAQAQAAKKAK